MGHHHRTLAALALLCCLLPRSVDGFSRAVHLHTIQPQPRLAAISTSPPVLCSALSLSAVNECTSRLRQFAWRASRVAAAALLFAAAPLGAAVAASSTTFGAVPLAARLSFALKQLVLQKAGLVVLAFAAIVVIFGGIMFKLVAGDSFSEGSFRTYSLLFDVPGADATTDETALGKLVSNGLFMLGVATFAVIIGIVSDKISSEVESLRLSNERVLWSGHTVIVNWGDYTSPMMRQLESARREGRLNGPVVILADKDKEEMDEELSEELGRIGAGLNVITRNGSPNELNNIDRVAAGTARRIIVLPQAEDADDEGESAKETTGLALALQRGLTKKQKDRAAVVVTAPTAEYSDEVAQDADGFGSYAEVYPEDFISRILAQCSVQPGLSHVYAELLLQGAGQEIYTEPLSSHRAMHGKSFGKASRRFSSAIPVGVVRQTPGGGEEEVLLSPPDEMLLESTDSMVLIAKARKDARPGGLRRMPRPARTRAAAAGEEEAVAEVTPAAKVRPPKILLLNLDPTMGDFIDQIDEVAPKGASITLLSPERPSGLPSLRRASLKHVSGDPTSPAELQKLGAHNFDAVIYLQHGRGSEVDDSKLLLSLLALEKAAKAEGAGVPRVVGEMHSPAMLELIASRWPANNWDFVLPNELCSGVLVQFALQPELRGIYSELLSPAGKEIVLKPAEQYANSPPDGRGVTFEELSLGARARGEVAVGVHRAGESKPTLNPPRDLRLKLQEGDQLVVLGDDF